MIQLFSPVTRHPPSVTCHPPPAEKSCRFDNDDNLTVLGEAEVVYVLQTSRDGSVAKPRSMLNKAIFDPWQRSLFSRQRTPGKEPLLAGK